VRVTIDGGPATIRLIVDDDGPGIPEAERERVLERFYRVGGGGAHAAGGSGLGLAIVAWVMDAHGGTVEVLAAPSGGTRVTLGFARPSRPHPGT
jgi:signal transduction histidine kinase